MSLPHTDHVSSLMRHSPSVISGMSTSSIWMFLGPTIRAALMVKVFPPSLVFVIGCFCGVWRQTALYIKAQSP